MLGTNLYLSHLLPGPINPRTIQAVCTGTAMTEIKHYSGKNMGPEAYRKKMKKVITETSGNEDEESMEEGRSWVELKGVKDVMASLLNLAAVEFSIRPHSGPADAEGHPQEQSRGRDSSRTEAAPGGFLQ